MRSRSPVRLGSVDWSLTYEIRPSHAETGVASMQLAYSLLADAAEVNPPTGRYFVFNGGVETIACLGLPGMIPTLTYVGKIRVLPHERGATHHAQVRCLRPNGELLFPPVESDFDPRMSTSPPDRPVYHLIVVNYRLVQVQEYGEHIFTITCDGDELGTVSFFVDPMPPDQVQRDVTGRSE